MVYAFKLYLQLFISYVNPWKQYSLKACCYFDVITCSLTPIVTEAVKRLELSIVQLVDLRRQVGTWLKKRKRYQSGLHYIIRVQALKQFVKNDKSFMLNHIARTIHERYERSCNFSRPAGQCATSMLGLSISIQPSKKKCCNWL